MKSRIVSLSTIHCAEHGTLAVVPTVLWNLAVLCFRGVHQSCHISVSSWYLRDFPQSFAEALAFASAVALDENC